MTDQAASFYSSVLFQPDEVTAQINELLRKGASDSASNTDGGWSRTLGLGPRVDYPTRTGPERQGRETVFFQYVQGDKPNELIYDSQETIKDRAIGLIEPATPESYARLFGMRL